ncbi:uncharacterized protein GGS22DRAFT_148652 [Annulohypoxylon maeteangense]|uniref:uncharacterized protein n=1 Tax=Annulohypoxylon maeteangense TaxID=1927788 RepID=UPI002007AD11|nr:uncharacterized protein GGS22DRAFT_148652 [Annulohypoxylon maeteangense]KAI0889584.1 hypothetical protein GGS22DRAFT_148652 [Annulohypoxylon maeteangense]
MAGLTGISIGIPASSIPTQREVEELPWKYRGYKDFTACVAADADFFAVRRFGRLHSRALLTLQDQIVELEKRLDAMDELFSLKTTKLVGSNPPVVVDSTLLGKYPHPSVCVSTGREPPEARDINNGTIRDDVLERAELISQIIAKLKEYDGLLLDHCSLMNMSAAPKRNIQNIETWFECNKGAIMEEETDFIKHRDDLISGCGEKKAILRLFFEDEIIRRTKIFMGLFRKNPPPSLSLRDRNEIFHFSDRAIDAFGSLATLIIALIMLIAPLWILQRLDDIFSKLAVITSFIIVCVFFLSFATLGRPFETLAATAGYSAVLVVFLQLGK